MAAPTNLLELAMQRSDAALQDEAAAGQALADARNVRDQARKDRDAAVAELAALESEIADIREALSQVETPADGEPLLEELGEKTIAHRAKQAELLDLDQELALATASEVEALADLKSASDRVKKTAADLATAQAESDARAAWTTALGEEPLSSLRANATAALDTDPENETFLAAKARIEDDIPSALIDRARQRRAAAAQPLSLAETALAGAHDLSDAKLEAQFRRAEAALRNYVTLGVNRYTQALALLAKVADPKNAPLTDEQKARITDTDIVSDGTTAASAEEDRDNARADLAEKEAALDQAILAAQVADIDADPNDDADVQTATTERDDAEDVLTSAEAVYTQELQDDLSTWEAAVPDGTWRLLDDFEEASAILNELKATDPASLTTNVDTTETAWLNALIAADKEARTTRLLDEEIASREAEAEFERSAIGRRRFQAVRGDS